MLCDFQKFALALYEERKERLDEETIRTCISRLYYALYHAVFIWVKANKNEVYHSIERCGSHQKLQRCLSTVARQEAQIGFQLLSMKLNTLHAKRCSADYELTHSLPVSSVELMIREVDDAFRLFYSLVVA